MVSRLMVVNCTVKESRIYITIWKVDSYVYYVYHVLTVFMV